MKLTMLKFSNGFIVLVFLCLCTIGEQMVPEKQIRSYSKELNLPAKSQKYVLSNVLMDLVDRNDVLHYLTCDDSDSEMVFCNATLITDLPDGLKSQDCNGFKIEPSDKSRKLSDPKDIKIMPLTNNRMVVYWYEEQKNSTSDYSYYYMGSFVINMLNCKIVKFPVFDVDVSLTYVLFPLVAYNDYVDFIVDNMNMCNEKGANEDEQPPLCRISYDEDGKRISDPTYFWPEYNDIGYLRPASLDSLEKGYFGSQLDFDNLKMTLSYLSPEGDTTILLNITEGIENELQLITVQSNAFEKFGLCWMPTSDLKNVNCLQYEPANSNAKINVTLEFPEAVEWIDMHNFVEGGFLLITGKCKNITESSYKQCDKFDVWEVKPDGSYSKLTDVDGLNLKCFDVAHDSYINIADNDKANEYCFYMTCENGPVPTETEDWKLQLVTKCIAKH